jgi:hypothetical protein
MAFWRVGKPLWLGGFDAQYLTGRRARKCACRKVGRPFLVPASPEAQPESARDIGARAVHCHGGHRHGGRKARARSGSTTQRAGALALPRRRAQSQSRGQWRRPSRSHVEHRQSRSVATNAWPSCLPHSNAAVSPSLRSQPNSAANAASVTGRIRPSVSTITADASARPRGPAGQYHNCRPVHSAARASSILRISSRSAAGAILRYRRCGSDILFPSLYL